MYKTIKSKVNNSNIIKMMTYTQRCIKSCKLGMKPE